MSEQKSTIVQPWLPLTALFASVLAFFGLSQPVSNTSEKESKAPTAITPTPNGLVSFPAGTWEDPFSQLSEAKKLVKGQEQSVLIGDKTSNLKELVFEHVIDKELDDSKGDTHHRTKLLILFSIVSDSMKPTDIETRLRARHAFEIAISSQGFRPYMADRISYVQLPGVRTYFTKLSGKKFNIEVPLKIYRKQDTAESILNIWIDQELLGEYPWDFIDSVVNDFADDRIKSFTQLAIFGPADSDRLKKMEPTFTEHRLVYITPEKKEANPNAASPGGTELNKPALKHENLRGWREWLMLFFPNAIAVDQSRLGKPALKYENLRGWRESLMWVSPNATVPIKALWTNQVNERKVQSDDIPIQFQTSIIDDEKMIMLLANELKLRLGLTVGRRTILLFVEQDREFGRSLAKLLTLSLVNSNTARQNLIDPGFNVEIIPYLRGISEMSEEEKEDGMDIAASGKKVTDYFRRTLNRQTSRSIDPEAEQFKPAAIGVLGGAWDDKIKLLQEIRQRFPQSLCFTNGYDARYTDRKKLDFARNLVIVSHCDPMPTIYPPDDKSPPLKIAFRDEYQAAQATGLVTLLQSVFPPNPSSSGQRQESQIIGAPHIFEIGRVDALKIASDADHAPLMLWLRGIVGVLCCLWCFLFPVLSYYDEALAKSKTISPNSLLSNDFRKRLSQVAAYLVPPLVLFVCAIGMPEQSTYYNPIGLISGINVVPSILLLSIAIPIIFRRVSKSEAAPFDFHNGVRDLWVSCDRLRTGSDDKRLAKYQPLDDTYKETIRRYRIGQYCISTFIILVGCVVWGVANDAWFVQTGILGIATAWISQSKTMTIATGFTLGINVLVGVARLYVLDYSLVPARDQMIRIVGSSVFIIAYWWLQIGLFKSIIFLMRLRQAMMWTSQQISKAEIQQVNRDWLKHLRTFISETGYLSRSILKDLGQFMLLGLLICVARLPLFDAWGMSIATWLTIFLPMIIPFSIAVMVRRRASYLRGSALRRIAKAKQDAKENDNASNLTSNRDSLDSTELMIKSFDEGAFAPLDRDPLVGASIALVLTLLSGPHGELLRKFLGLFFV